MQELNVYAFAAAKQTSRGALASAPVKRGIHVAGDLKPTRDEGSEQYSDLTKFGDATDFLNSLSGAGTPGWEMTASELAYLLWLYHGAETVSAPVNAVHSWAITGGPPTSGTITVRLHGVDITLQWNSTAGQAQTAIAANPYFTGNVSVTGGPWPGTPLTVTYNSGLAGRPMPLPTVVNNALAPSGNINPTVTTAGVKRRHRFVGSSLAFFYSTWWKRVGRTEVDRHKFGDCRIGSMVLENSTANKVGRVTPTIFSLDPAIHQSADPTWPAMPIYAPLLHTEGRGAYNLDGVIHEGLTQQTITMNEDLSPVYGDDTLVQDLVAGQPAATIGAAILLDADGHAMWNRQVFGTATPVDGQKPSRDVSALGSFTSSLEQRDSYGDKTGERLDTTFPGVKWAIPEKPDPNPAGGSAEISIAGAMRVLSGQEPYTIDVYCDDVAFT